MFYETALNVAVRKGNADVVKLLVNHHGINVNSITVISPLFFYS